MQNQRLKTRYIRTLDEFAECAESWNELAGHRVFHRWEWMFSWWESFQGQGELAILVVTDEFDRWMAIAPWYLTNTIGRGCEARVLGSGKACSDYVSLAIRSGYEQQVIPVIAREMVEQESEDSIYRQVDTFHLEGHTADDPAVARLVQSLRTRSAAINRTEIGATWRTELTPTWTEFESRLHKSFRRKTKKASKRLADREFSSLIFTDPAAIREIWPTFVRLHQARRKSLDQDGCFNDPRFEKFLFNAAARLANMGMAQINVVQYQGQPFTSNLEFTGGDSVFMYQTGMDPEYLSLEPGHINFTLAIQNSIDRERVWFDFLRGDEPYKARWNAQRVPVYRTNIVPRRWKSIVRHGIWNVGQNVRDLTKIVFGNMKP